MTDVVLENTKCHIHSIGCGGPVVFWGMADRGDDSLSAVISCLEDAALPCTLFAFEAEDWNRAFSPWEFRTEDMYFPGGGADTLRWLETYAVPYAVQHFSDTDKYLTAGYSLSGLFALWAFYESDLFCGAACCSGSLWFGDWDNYAKAASASPNSVVYLSLGGKESNSHNPLMASIGEKYKLQEKLCKNDPNISKVIFEMNSGGHFANPPKRIAKGIVQIIKELP